MEKKNLEDSIKSYKTSTVKRYRKELESLKIIVERELQAIESDSEFEITNSVLGACAQTIREANILKTLNNLDKYY